MNRIVSVDKTILAGGNIKWYVTTEDSNQNCTRIEVGEAEALRFQKVLQDQSGQGQQRLLTETIP